MTKSITKKQIQLIHIAKNKLGLDDDDYRGILADLFNATSSKDLSASQAYQLIDHFKSCGFTLRRKKRPKADNVIHLTSPKQRRLIDILSKRFSWRRKNGFNLWLGVQKDKGYIKSVSLNESRDAHWVIEKLKLMTGTTTANINMRERPHAMG